jgi:hypothetical protein
MPFPEFFTSLLRSPRFWRDFFWLTDDSAESYSDDPPYPELEDFTLPLPVADGFGLSLAFDSSLITFSLGFVAPREDPVIIAWDDQAHWHPHVLRWWELETICRAIALDDGALSHPGWVVLLLHRFAPICMGDDVEAITATLESAWRQVGGFSDNEITAFIEPNDARDARFCWREIDSLGWVIEQEDELRTYKGLYTLRSEGNEEFPFAAWAQTIEAARTKVAQLTSVNREAAEKFAAEGGAGAIPGIVSALGVSGHAGLAASLESSASPAQASWICEAILDQPYGTIARRHLSHECLPRKQHHLHLCIPFNDKQRPLPEQYAKFFADTLGGILRAMGIGSCECSGGTSIQNESGEYVEIESSNSVHLTGNLEQGLDLVRNLLWWGRAPASVRAGKTYDYEIPLHLESGPMGVNRLVLELAHPMVFRWKSGYRIDRAVLSPTCQRAIHELIGGYSIEGPSDDGWFTLRTGQHDLIDLGAKGLGASESLRGITVVIDDVTPSAASFLFRLMQTSELVLLPVLIATSSSAAKSLSAPWPTVTIVESDAELHEILTAGAFHWWSRP